MFSSKLILLAMDLIKMGAKSHTVPYNKMSTLDDLLNLVRNQPYLGRFPNIFPSRSSNDGFHDMLVSKGDWSLLYDMYGEDPLGKYDKLYPL